jgi:hypothetical protein
MLCEREGLIGTLLEAELPNGDHAFIFNKAASGPENYKSGESVMLVHCGTPIEVGGKYNEKSEFIKK